MKRKLSATNSQLFKSIKSLIEQSKTNIALTVNSELTVLYWRIGKLIKSDILNNKKAGYGDAVIESLAVNLTAVYGKGWTQAQLWNCLRVAEVIGEDKILYAVSRELTWTHLRILIYIEEPSKRNFYFEFCRKEHWSTRILKDRIDSMLYERTALSKRPEKVIKKELSKLKNRGAATPDLVFRDPYILNFLGLKETYSETDLETAILNEIQNFIIEFGTDFAFIARQKRIVIDNEDFKIDLLFYHRSLKRLVAIDLKLGKFKPAYKGQMELYLKWLDKHERKKNEASPIGLILCAEKQREQIELLELNRGNIRVAEYLTQLPQKKVLAKKLHLAIEQAQNQNEKK